MDRNIIDYDPSLFGIRTSRWQIDSRGRSGQEGVITGQVIYGRQPRWKTSLQMVPGRSVDLLAWRSIVAQMEGRINALRIHIRDPLRPRYADITPGYSGGSVPFGDGALFDDGSGFAPGMTAPILADAPAGATSLQFDAGYLNNTLSGGHIFSINDWPYQATRIEGTGSDAVVHFKMPLRRPVVAGDEIDLNAIAIMILDDDLQGGLDLNESAMASPALMLTEWVGPGRP